VTTGRSPFASTQAGTAVRPSVRNGPELYCLQCASAYVANGGTTELFAIWNGTNITEELPPAATPGSALESLSGGSLPGGCYTCPDFGVRAVHGTSTRMCELRPGFTTDYRSVASEVQLTVTAPYSAEGAAAPTAILEEALPSPPQAYGLPTPMMPDRRRHRRRALLQAQPTAGGGGDTSNGQPTQTSMRLAAADAAAVLRAGGGVQRVFQKVPAARMPAFVGDDHFTCCDHAVASSAPAVDDCRVLRGPTYHGLNMLTGRGVQEPCGNGASNARSGGSRRRLLQVPQTEFGAAVQAWLANRTGVPPASACYTGTYKPRAGDGPCYFCTAGASTTGPDYAGASLARQCACLPGFYGDRLPSIRAGLYTADTNATDLDKGLVRCLPCPNGTYRSALQQNDSACQPCPPRMYTPGPGSAYCYCVPGTYPNTTFDACAPCEAGFFCDGNAREHCPDQSTSAPGAADRGECVCNPGTHYGDLSQPDGVCLPRPPGYVCQNSSEGGAGAIGCGCAEGWTTAVASGGSARCISPCTAGQFAELQPHSQNLKACVPCPPDTYASDGGLIGACTACPLGRGTFGLEVRHFFIDSIILY
jgi:hypothetical protein